MTRDRTTLTEHINAQLIAAGMPEECVVWVCEEHRRHCTRMGSDHAEHVCIWCLTNRGDPS